MVINKIWSSQITTCSLVVGMNVLLLSPTSSQKWPWRWSQYVALKEYPSMKPYGIISQRSQLWWIIEEIMHIILHCTFRVSDTSLSCPSHWSMTAQLYMIISKSSKMSRDCLQTSTNSKGQWNDSWQVHSILVSSPNAYGCNGVRSRTVTLTPDSISYSSVQQYHSLPVLCHIHYTHSI